MRFRLDDKPEKKRKLNLHDHFNLMEKTKNNECMSAEQLKQYDMNDTHMMSTNF